MSINKKEATFDRLFSSLNFNYGFSVAAAGAVTGRATAEDPALASTARSGLARLA
jgi:hypothetical protein